MARRRRYEIMGAAGRTYLDEAVARLFGTPQLTTYTIRRRLLIPGRDYWIEDEAGARVFKIVGKVRFARIFSINDAQNNPLYKVREKPLCIDPTFLITQWPRRTRIADSDEREFAGRVSPRRMATWKDILKTAGKEQTLLRAQSALGLKTVYKLGKGGFDPARPMTPSCDCSGFVAWAIGIPRELPPKSDRWLDTDAYYAGGKPVKAGLFSEVSIDDAEPGDLLVYPDKGGHQGHIGIITQVDLSAPTYVIHCSLGNYKNYNDAIRITGPGVFLAGNNPTRAMRIDYAALKMFL